MKGGMRRKSAGFFDMNQGSKRRVFGLRKWQLFLWKRGKVGATSIWIGDAPCCLSFRKAGVLKKTWIFTRRVNIHVFCEHNTRSWNYQRSNAFSTCVWPDC